MNTTNGIEKIGNIDLSIEELQIKKRTQKMPSENESFPQQKGFVQRLVSLMDVVSTSRNQKDSTALKEDEKAFVRQMVLLVSACGTLRLMVR